MLYNAGSVAGIGVSFLTGMKAATWATTAMGPLKWVGVGLGAVDTGFDGYGAAIATNNLNQSYQNNGKFEIEDAWNLAAYVPFGLAAIKGIKGVLGASNLPKNGIQGVNDVLGDTQKAVTKAGNCFVADTEILTVDGIKNIEDIVVGDWVIADDPTTPGGIEKRQVLDTFVRETDALVDLYVDGEVISTTGEHPFWVADKGWVEAKDLVVGSLLQTGDGRIVDVDKIERREGNFKVYNFEVEGIPTYFVSDLGVLVHNVCGDGSELVNLVEEDPSDLGRWFARYDSKYNELFSARLEEGGHLQIGWVGDGGVPQIANNIREIQRYTGQPITKISGYASDGIEKAIKAGSFNSELYEKTLARRLGGEWKIEITPKSGSTSWDIIATRNGG
ncbi:polymorphic toxin-type HINT domain-containing protein [Microcoleus sp. herbarium8]